MKSCINLCVRRLFVLTLAVGLMLGVLTVPFARAEEISPPDGFVTAVENSVTALFYKPDRAEIAVFDKRTGHLWYSALPEEQTPAEDLTGYLKDEFVSLLNIGYVLINKKDTAKVDQPLASMESHVTASVTGSVLVYSIRLTDVNLAFEVEISLNNDVMTVSLPNKSIREGDGVEEKLQSRIKSLTDFADSTEDIMNMMLDADDYPKKFQSGLKSGLKRLEEFSDLANSLSASGIEADSDKLSEIINSLQADLAGTNDKPGFFRLVSTSSVVSDDAKRRYASLQSEIDDKMMLVRVTAGGLKAIDIAHLVDVELFPYFGACGDRAKGYILYPNGSGAINEFKENHSEFNSEYRAMVFSDDQPDIDWEKTIDNAGLKRLPVPYFGIKRDNSAFISYVDSGQPESFVRFAPSGYIVDVNRVHAGFVYRRPVAVASKGGQWQAGQIPTAYEDERASVDAVVRYRFLSGEEADYSGMARALRSYLLDSGALKKTTLYNGSVPLALDFFGGYSERMMLFENYRIGTTFDQARGILEQISGGGSFPFLVNYRGFQTGGYGVYPAKNSAASQLGGLSGLRELAEFTAGSGGSLFLEANPLEVQVGQRGYAESELALNTYYRVVESLDKTTHILSPSVAKDKMESVWAFYRSAGASGAVVQYAGSFVYYDYSSKHPHRRSDTVDEWGGMLARGKEELGNVSVEGGNIYTWAHADWIRNVPVGASGYVHTDYAVPFYQMLVHGSIPYTAEPVNRFYDKDLQFLRMVEYGSLPYFTLSAGEVDYEQTGSFLSPFDVVYSDIVEIYNRYASSMAGTVNMAIISHKNENGIVTVVYEDGAEVVINYTAEPVDIGGRRIEALDYIVVNGKGGELLEKTENSIDRPGEQSRLSVYNPLGNWIWGILLVPVVLFIGSGFFRYKRQHNV